MKEPNLFKSENFLASIEAEHYANKQKIATGDLKTPSHIVNSDILIQLEKLKKATPKEARAIKFSDHSVGYGTSLHQVKKILLEKGIDEKHIVENQLFGMDIDPDKVLATRLVIDPNRKYNNNIIVGDSRTMSFETKGITHSWNNEPYLKGDGGKTPVYGEIIENVDKQNPVQQSESHLLPFGISLSDSLRPLLNNFFSKGLEHWRGWGIDSFEGAKVRTVSYICNKGYNGKIKMWYDNNFLFEYDFRRLGYIINGGTAGLTDLLVNVRNQNKSNPMYVSQSIHFDKIKATDDDVKKEKFKDSVPILIRNRNAEFDMKKDVGYVHKSKISSKDLDKPKMVFGYRPNGGEYGTHSFCTINVIPKGVAVLSKDQYQAFDTIQQANNRKQYLHSGPIENFFLKRSRTQPTIDARKPRNTQKMYFNQLSFIDNVDPTIIFKNNDAIIDYFSKKYNLSKQVRNELANESSIK